MSGIYKLGRVVLVIAVVAIAACYCVINDDQMILQGEVDTKSIDLSSKITGRVKYLHVKEGENVKAGQLLITLDIPDIVAKNNQAKAAVEAAKAKKLRVDNGARAEIIKIRRDALIQAESSFNFAQKNYNRMKELRESNSISQRQLEEAENSYKIALKQKEIAQENLNLEEQGERFEDKLLAEASLKQAENTQKEVQSYLDESAITSPISGQIKEITVDEGELISAGYPLVTVVNTEDAWIVFNLREDMIQNIKVGTEFYVNIPAVRSKPIRVRVYYISAMGNYTAWRATKIRGDFDLKTFEIRARPIEKIDGLVAGMTANAQINLRTKEFSSDKK